MQLPLLTPSLPTGLNYAGPLMLSGDPQLPLELRLHLLSEQNQTEADKAPAKSPSGVHITRPVWRDLSSDDQATLAGLEAVWPFISNAEKRRWLAIAKESKGMSEIDRERLSLNITNWGNFNENQRQGTAPILARSTKPGRVTAPSRPMYARNWPKPPSKPKLLPNLQYGAKIWYAFLPPTKPDQV